MTPRLTRLGTALVLAALFAWPARAAEPPKDLVKQYGTDPASVLRHGKGYRYPQAGWIVVHIEGKPYERGYQHGKLLAPEIAEYIKVLAVKRGKNEAGAIWDQLRMTTNALFVRKYDPEFLEEMKGIADGAAEAGATFNGRALDFLDIVTLNSDIELEFLESALEATANGLEGKRFKEPKNQARPAADHPEHCSAFAATGPATADGKIVFGHITMFNIAFVNYFNVWLDIKPEKGHRVLMQTYPGGIQSGMDYYMNDAGLLVTETTISQTKFDVTGLALASRIRKTLQYADSIDKAVAILGTSSNGLYTNEWLLGDTKTNEIAMFELGTHTSKLWRSGKDEWYGGTKGFYWGCNNGKDQAVRLETVASVEGKPANLVWHPSDRDQAWLKLYNAHKGKIDADFGFKAFTTPPLAAFPSLDAKFTTSEMAKDLKVWAIFGNPLGRTWEPTEFDRNRVPGMRSLIPNDWTVLAPDAPPALPKGTAVAVDLGGKGDGSSGDDEDVSINVHEPAWHGTIFPRTPADSWLAAAFADYERIVSIENALHVESGDSFGKAEQKKLDAALYAHRSRYATAVRRWGKDVPLDRTVSDVTQSEWYEIAANKGVLLLAELHKAMGHAKFVGFMDAFGRANAGKPVATADFRVAAEKAAGKPLAKIFDPWLTRTGLPGVSNEALAKNYWSVDSFEDEPEKALIVFGTLKDVHAHEEAAERLQQAIRRRWSNVTVPIKADSAVTEEDLKDHHLLLVGRPDSNAISAKLSGNLPVQFTPGSFKVGDVVYGHARSSVIAAGSNPRNPRYSAVLFAGLGAESTWRCVDQMARRQREYIDILVWPAGSEMRRHTVTGGEPTCDMCTHSDK